MLASPETNNEDKDFLDFMVALPAVSEKKIGRDLLFLVTLIQLDKNNAQEMEKNINKANDFLAESSDEL